jgi:D-galactose 1-dehydrogenase
VTLRIALIGFGKIAEDQHLPAIAANPDFELAAIVSLNRPSHIRCPVFSTVGDMFAGLPGGIDAVAICTPPVPRFAIACEVITAGLPVLFEKPPTATLGELDYLIALARLRNVPIFTAWHSQYAAGVPVAARALKGEAVTSLTMLWREDVRKYHPGQQWIWQPGGFGVFDPAINGFSILNNILDEPLLVNRVSMLFPANRQTPISAEVLFHGDDRKAILDWRGGDEDEWKIQIETASGKSVRLMEGGAQLEIDGAPRSLPPRSEYRAIYEDFADVVRRRCSKIDRDPLRIVADCFLAAERNAGDDFA